MSNLKRPVLRYHGSKWRIAPWIISHFPKHRIYVEAFGGSASLLLRKAPSEIEIYNDLDEDVVNFFKVLRDPVSASRLSELIRLTPYSRNDYDEAFKPADDSVEKARRLAIRSALGFGSNAGTRMSKCGFRGNDWKARKSNAHVWTTLPDAIQNAIARFSGVVIENLPATKLIEAQDGPETLFYLDPPYVFKTRSSFSSGNSYRHEMTDEDHAALAAAAKSAEGFVVVSGYQSELYDALYKDWTRVEKTALTQGNAANRYRVECLWLSPRTAQNIQTELFQEV